MTQSNNAEHVIKIDAYNELATGPVRNTDAYDDLPILATAGLHQHVFNLFKSRVKPGQKVLELAAGAGAMCKRLLDNGYTVTASDLSEVNFRIKEKIPFVKADFNLQFADNFTEQYDSIVALEIVEHLENARNFFRQCKKRIKPGGYLFVSTPNTENALSIASLMRFGHPNWFNDSDYSDTGHINPMMSWHFTKMAKEAGYAIDYIGSFGDIMPQIRSSIKLTILTRFIKMLSVKQIHQGEILVCIFRVLE